MKKKKRQPEPDWVRDDLPPRTDPYTEEELDTLTDGVIKGIEDTTAWLDLVRKRGVKEARQIVREGIFAKGPSMLDEKPNLN
jgi:DNA-binding IclR family transcriptional regulator